MPCKHSRKASQAIPSDRAVAGTLGRWTVRSAPGAKGPGFSRDAPQEQDALEEGLFTQACLGASPLQPRGPEPGTPFVGGHLSSVRAALGGASALMELPPSTHRGPRHPCVHALSPCSFSFSNFSSFQSSQSCPCIKEMMIYLVVRLINVLPLSVNNVGYNRPREVARPVWLGSVSPLCSHPTASLRPLSSSSRESLVTATAEKLL